MRGVALAPKLASVDFDLRGGEVLGIAGLLGSGRTELIEIVMERRAASAGTVSVDGAVIRRPRYRPMLRLGFGYTPESRKEDGIILLLGVDENTVMTDLAGVARHGMLSARAIQRHPRRGRAPASQGGDDAEPGRHLVRRRSAESRDRALDIRPIADSAA